MDTNEEGLEHFFDEDNSTIVEEQPREVDVHVIEQASPITNVAVGGPRSMVWPEFVVIPTSEFDDGRSELRKHCESKTFLADSRYGTSNMKKHLDKCPAYQATKAARVASGEATRSFPTDEEWERVTRIHKLLGPFCDITDMFFGNEYPTTNLYFENVWKIDMFLKEQSHSRDQVIRDMVLNMRAKFDKYWSEYTLLFAFATILDLRCKKVFLKYCYKKLYEDEEKATFKLSQVIAKLKTLLKEYTMCVNPPTNVASVTSSSTISGSFETPSYKRKFNYLAEFDESELDGNSGTVRKTILDTYLEDPKIERKRELDVMTFWKENAEQYKKNSLIWHEIF